MNWLLLAGGLLFTPTPTTAPTQDVATLNHTLAGEPIPAKEVVTRNRWGTPMPPDGTGGYSLIQPIVPEYIARSLIQPPRTSGPIFRPAPRE